MSRPPLLPLALLAVLATAACTDRQEMIGLEPQAASVQERGEGIKVMSQNLYLGANLDLLLSAQGAGDVAMVFQQLGVSTLTGGMGAPAFGRAFRIAQQIAMEAPHLVGLQEVTRYDMITTAGTQTLGRGSCKRSYVPPITNWAAPTIQISGTMARLSWASEPAPR